MSLESQLAKHAISLGLELDNLAILDDLAHNARILMLGEQDHSDGASFVFKEQLKKVVSAGGIL